MIIRILAISHSILSERILTSSRKHLFYLQELLEKILETDLMFHIERFSSLNSDERSKQVTQSLKYILQLNELNLAFAEKNNRSTLAEILCKLPIRV